MTPSTNSKESIPAPKKGKRSKDAIKKQRISSLPSLHPLHPLYPANVLHDLPGSPVSSSPNDSDVTSYIIEVGYEKTYQRTYRQHLNIVKNFQPSLPIFQNVWRKSMEGIATLNDLLSGFYRSPGIVALDFVLH